MARLKDISYLLFVALLPATAFAQSSKWPATPALTAPNSLPDSSALLKEAINWENRGNQLPETDTSATGKIASLQKALSLYRELNNVTKEIELLKEIAKRHMRLGNNTAAETDLMALLALQKPMNQPGIQNTYDLLTILHRSNGNLNRALLYALEAVKSAETLLDEPSRNMYYYRLGQIYLDLGQVEKSLPLLKKLVDAYQKGNEQDVFQLYVASSVFATALLQNNQPEAALTFLLDMSKKRPPTKPQEKGILALALAKSYNAVHMYDLAERYFLEALDWEQKQPHGFAVHFNIYYNLGKFYDQQAQYSKVNYYLKEALATKGTFALAAQQDIYRLLFRADSAAGNYPEAIRHFQIHKILNDSIFNIAKSRQIEELQIQYETTEKEKDIRLLQNEGQLQQIKLQKATITKNLTLVGIAFLIILLGLLYNRYLLNQRTNRQLEIQQIEINQTNAMLQKLLEEKEWLLREIHHRVKNNLQIVMSLLNTQSVYLENDDAFDAIRHSQQRIHSISLIHQKLYQSNNMALIDMPAYIRELVDYLRESFDTDCQIHFELQVDPVELDVSQAVPVGLILNEAISNAIKYAFPRQRHGLITIVLQHTTEDRFLLSISDNGLGLPKDFHLNNSKSLGMSLMKGLSKQLDGTFEIQSDNGMTISITFAGQLIYKSGEASVEIPLIT